MLQHRLGQMVGCVARDVVEADIERLQRRVALEALSESESSLGAEAVGRDTASTGAEAGAEACQGALTQKRTL